MSLPARRSPSVRVRIPVFVFACALLAALPAAGPGVAAAPPGPEDPGAAHGAPGAAGEWPGWRGPRGDGTVEATGLFGTEPFGLKVDWTRKLGNGYASIAVAGGRLVTAWGDGTNDLVGAFDPATGEPQWTYTIGETYPAHDGGEGGPLAMPAIAGDTVFGLGANGELFALDAATGAERWRRDLTGDGAKAPFYGFTTTPVPAGDVVLVQTGAAGKALTAYDAKTGKPRWSAGDAETQYQTPLVAELAGVRQAIVAGKDRTLGLSLDDGRVLWSFELEDTDAATPAVIGGDRLLRKNSDGHILYSVQRKGEDWTLEELWRESSLRRTFAMPVHHEGHLYGFDGRFLVAVDAATGEQAWKSRPPGGRALILVDGHLVIHGNDGNLVVVEANPKEYVEKASVQVGKSPSYTPPTFADGALFLRDIESLTRVAIGPAAPQAAEGPAEPRNDFERFLVRLRASDRKTLLLDDYMRAQESFPIVENDRWVHFLYRGDAEDVAVRGAMIDWDDERTLEPVEGTDLRHLSLPIEPGARFEYQYNVDFENRGPDPLNPRRLPRGFSEVWTSGYERDPLLGAYTGDARGRIETFEHESAIRETKREVRVYLPHGYDTMREALPLVVVPVGQTWLDDAQADNTLDAAFAAGVPKAVVAFVPPAPDPWYENGGQGSEDAARMFAEELVPELERRYRLRTDAAGRSLLARGDGAIPALLAALRSPTTFGEAYLIGYWESTDVEPMLERALATGGARPDIHLVWFRYDLRGDNGGWDFAKASAALAERLTRAGVPVSGGEKLDCAGWGAWLAEIDDALRTFRD